MFEVAKTSVYVKRLLTSFATDYSLDETEDIALTLFCDRQTAIARIDDTEPHACTKNYNIELEWLRERQGRTFKTHHIGTADQQGFADTSLHRDQVRPLDSVHARKPAALADVQIRRRLRRRRGVL